MHGDEPVTRRVSMLSRSNSVFRNSILLPVNTEDPHFANYGTTPDPPAVPDVPASARSHVNDSDKPERRSFREGAPKMRTRHSSYEAPPSPSLSRSFRRISMPVPKPSVDKSVDKSSDLILRRLAKSKELRGEAAEKESQRGLAQLQRRFSVRQPVPSSESQMYEFWTKVVNQYAEVAQEEPQKLREAIQRGFPPEIRGILWQVIAGSKSEPLELLYAQLVLEKNVPCESGINKDLNRTPMAPQINRDSLARVLKAYSIFDADVGYTQGMAFIVVPLLMELNEPECFSLFVQLMKIYDFRSMFVTDMPGLHEKLYQFERLLEDNYEPLSTHLRRQGIHPTMYASQWFITLFSYRFPTSLVERIFDIVIAEGLDALLRFAVALMAEASPKLLELNGIDDILPFLKDKIFDTFLGNENELVLRASAIELVPKTLASYTNEYIELTRVERERSIQLETLRNSNVRLTSYNRELNLNIEDLNKEHLRLADKLLKSSIEIANLKGENQELKETVEATKRGHEMYSNLDEIVHSQQAKIQLLSMENNEVKRELEMYKKSEKVKNVSSLMKKLKAVEETNKRYETQLLSLQESLASALNNQ